MSEQSQIMLVALADAGFESQLAGVAGQFAAEGARLHTGHGLVWMTARPFATRRGLLGGIRRDRLKSDLVTFQKMLEQATLACPCLPGRFGDAARGAEDLDAAIAAQATALLKATEAHAGTWQWSVEITRDPVAVLAHLKADGHIGEASLMNPKAAIDTIRSALSAHRAEARLTLDRAIAGTIVDAIDNGAGEDPIVASLTVQLPRGGEAAFEAALEAFDTETGGAFSIGLRGPLPPCNFAAVRLDSADNRKLAAARDLLGVGPDAGARDIHNAWREHARKVHPDTGADADSAADAMQRLSEARDLLEAMAAAGRDVPVVLSVAREDDRRRGFAA